METLRQSTSGQNQGLCEHFDIPFVRFHQEVAYEGHLAELIRCLILENTVRQRAELLLWCGASVICDEWFIVRHDYCLCETDVKARFYRDAGELKRLRVHWHNYDIFFVRSDCWAGIFFPLEAWMVDWVPSCLLYVLPLVILAYGQGL